MLASLSSQQLEICRSATLSPLQLVSDSHSCAQRQLTPGSDASKGCIVASELRKSLGGK